MHNIEHLESAGLADDSAPLYLSYSQEQDELRTVLRRFLAERSPESEVRRLMDDPLGYDPEVWGLMAQELGLPGLLVDEKFGGTGLGSVEMAVVLEEAGAALYGGPFLSSAVLAVAALTSARDRAAEEAYLPRIADGSTIATLAIAEDAGSYDLEQLACEAEFEVDRWLLSGHKSYVTDGHVATLVLVAARTVAGMSLFAVDAEAAPSGLVRRRVPNLDETRPLARLEFDRTPARLVGAEGDAESFLDHVLDLAAVALAAEQIGGARACLDAAVEYAKSRVQFGRPIGSFQAIKHRLADAFVELEAARSSVQYAAWAAANGSAELPVIASLAKAFCSEAYVRCAGDNIQVHGGVGFTWEHSAHLYFKRASVSELLFGDPTYHREQLARRIGL